MPLCVNFARYSLVNIIEKNVFTKEEILQKIDFNMELWEDLVKENKKLLKLTNDILDRLPEEEKKEEEVFSSLYYGPLGEC